MMMKTLGGVTLGLMLWSGTGWAQPAAGNPVILEPKPGAVLSSPVAIVLGMSDSPGSPQSLPALANGAHFHVLLDAPIPPAGKMFPMDARDIHLLHGESRKTVPLKPGTHTIQVVEGTASHTAVPGGRRSDPVTFEVK